MSATLSYKTILTNLCAGQDLSAVQMNAVANGILSGEWTPVQTAAVLIALKIKGEKPTELAAAASVMRQMATAVSIDDIDNVVDTCGTGGDETNTFNVSTAAAFVTAACGVPVAKHGNRAVSSVSGSSDVLASLGMPLDLSPAAVARSIKTVGIGFMFAPNHHAVTRHVVPVRRELVLRTIFSLLGPLTNPAGVRRQVIGVFSRDLLLPYAETLAQLGSVHALVVHGDGLDEISISGETDIAELKDGAIIRRTIAPEDVGLVPADLATIQVASIDEARQRLLSVLAGVKGPARDITLLNTAAALIVGGAVDDFPAGVERAATAIDSGAAQQKLQDFLQATAA